jgi:hypothetical protein
VPWDLDFMNRTLERAKDRGQPREFRMNSRNFANLKKLHRDELNFSNKREELKVGIFGWYLGLIVRVLRTVPADTLLIHDEERCLYHAVQDTLDEPHSGAGGPEECDRCLVHRVMAQ